MGMELEGGRHRLAVGDSVELTAAIPCDCIDLTVTSPPYDDLRDYTGEGAWTWASFEALAKELYRVTTPGGVLVWVVADASRAHSESGSSMRQAIHLMECGFRLADTMIYRKANPGGARGSNRLYLQCWEYMFVFSKGPLGTSNLIADRPNRVVGALKGGASLRGSSGVARPTKRYTSQPLGRRFNIWSYPTQSDAFSTQHPAPFPVALAEDHIRSWSNPGDLVLDPFCGSGTTLVAALGLGRRAIGFDIATSYVDLARRRLAAVGLEEVASDLSAAA